MGRTEIGAQLLRTCVSTSLSKCGLFGVCGNNLYFSQQKQADVLLQNSSSQNLGEERTTKILVSYLAIQLNSLEDQPDNQEEVALVGTKTKLRTKLLKILSELPVRDEFEILQSLDALVCATVKTGELDADALGFATRILESVLQNAQDLYQVSEFRSLDLLALAVQSVSNVLKAARQCFGSDDKMVENLRKIISKSIEVVEGLTENELQHQTIGETAIQEASDYVSVMANRYNPEEIQDINIDKAKFSLPPSMDSILTSSSYNSTSVELVNSTDEFNEMVDKNCIQAHMTVYKENPYDFGIGPNQMIDTEVSSLTLYTCGGQKIQVDSLSDADSFTIEMPRNTEKKNEKMSHVLEKSRMNIHEFHVSNENLEESLYAVVELVPVTNGRLFPIRLVLGNASSSSSLDYVHQIEFKEPNGNLTFFLPSGKLNESGKYYLGIVDATYNSGRLREGEITQRRYTLEFWWGTCLFWDEIKWSNRGCWPTEHSTLDVAQCRCNHLTAFGSHFELIPNDLNFVDTESFFDLHENPVTFVVIIAIFCIYLSLLYIYQREDKHDSRKGGLVNLQDNRSEDQQRYEVVVETGFRKGAGTTAKISLILHGEDGMSETRELISDDDRPLFERNSRDRFLLSLKDSIGKVWKVQLWHNNFGPSPSWYLSRVIVKDLQTGKAYYFICEKWFAVEEDEGKVERELTVLEGHPGFNRVFWAKGTQYLADFHLWSSLFTYPSYSRFTRAQRLTCALTLLLSYMCVNAMWYQTSETEYRGEFGLLDLSWRSVVVGAVTCAMVLPVNLMLVFLFRRSKIKYPGPDTDETDDKDDGDDTGQDDTTQSNVTYSILEQSILNWQNIQDWAQKQWVKRQHSLMSSTATVKTSQQGQGDTGDQGQGQIQVEEVHGQTQSLQQVPSSPALTSVSERHDDKRDATVLNELDQASSGFEDSNSQAQTQQSVDTRKSKPPSVSTVSTDSASSRNTVTSLHHYKGCKTKSHRRLFLPFWCRYIAWVMCAVISVGCAVVTVLYGFRFGHTKSTMWLQSLYFSFMVCVFILHPVLIFLLATYTAVRYMKDASILDHHEDGFYGRKARHFPKKKKRHSSVECCEECEELERGVAARQRSRYLRFARPPQEKTLIESRKKILKEKKAWVVLKESATYFTLLFVLCVMAYGKDSSSPYYLNEALKNSFVRTGTPAFLNIKTYSDWWTWSQTHLFKELYPESWHNGDNRGIENKFISQVNSHLIGHTHLRQLRVMEEDCKFLSWHSPLEERCRFHYESQTKSADESNLTGKFEEDTKSSDVYGHHGVYDGSGLVIILNNTRSSAYSQLQSLRSSDWLNRQTRALILEFTMYNAPTNLFSSATLLLEFPPTGRAHASSKISSTYIFRYVSNWDNFVLGCELLFVVLAFYKVKVIVFNFVKFGINYFKSFWHTLQAISGVLSVLYVIAYVYRFILVSDIIEHLRSTYYSEFVNISFLCLWDEILRSLVAVLLFLFTIRLLRLLRYKKLFAMFGSVYRRASKELLMLCVLFMVMVCSFTSLGYALFGAVSLGFRDFWTSLYTMVALLSGSYKESDYIEYKYPSIVVIFIVSYLMFCVGLLTSYSVAILSNQMRVYKKRNIIAMNVKEAARFFWEKLRLAIGLKKSPPLREPDSGLPPEFTMAEIEYQVDELLFRMNAITGSAGLPEKAPLDSTDSDITYGGGDDGISSGGSEGNVIPLEDRLEQRVQKIEDNLITSEPYLAQLIKLDSIGADLLSSEREKQLRSHLELEIFRRLQMQRQEKTGLLSIAPSVGSSYGSNTKTGLNGSSLERSPSSLSTGSRKLLMSELPRLPELDVLENNAVGDNDLKKGQVSASLKPPKDEKIDEQQLLEHVLLSMQKKAPKRSPSMSSKKLTIENGSHSSSDAKANLSPKSVVNTKKDPAATRKKSERSGSSSDSPPEKIVRLNLGKTGIDKARIASTSSSDSPGEKHITLKHSSSLKSTSSERCSSSSNPDSPKDRPIRAAVGEASLPAKEKCGSNHSSNSSTTSPNTFKFDGGLTTKLSADFITRVMKKPIPPLKPKFLSSVMKEFLPADSTQSKNTVKVPKGCPPSSERQPLKLEPNVGVTVPTESSSGSEEGALQSGRKPFGKRNLRKTKSRGKGKGSGSLTPTLFLDEDIALEEIGLEEEKDKQNSDMSNSPGGSGSKGTEHETSSSSC